MSKLEQILSFEPDKIVGSYRFSLNALVGEGSFSKVYAGFNVSGEMVAIKVIETRSLDSYLRDQLRKEIFILENLNHPNIVKIYDVIETLNNVYVITEFCKEGDLASELEKYGYFEEEKAIHIMKDILK